MIRRIGRERPTKSRGRRFTFLGVTAVAVLVLFLTSVTYRNYSFQMPSSMDTLGIMMPQSVKTPANEANLQNDGFGRNINGSIACSKIDRYIVQESTKWYDPNEGIVYARRVFMDPKVIISVHTQEYDPLRWNTIYEKGRYYEHDVLKRFNSILAPPTIATTTGNNNVTNKPGIVVDVGANIGYYTMVSAALGHTVYAFEINPSNIIRLCQSARLNHVESQITIIQKGVSNMDDESLAVSFSYGKPGQAALADTAGKMPNEKKGRVILDMVKTVTLDSFARERGWFADQSTSTGVASTLQQTHVKLLKIDVEGGEARVIEGAKQFLLSGIAENILLELRFGGHLFKQAHALMTLVIDGGYLGHEGPGGTKILHTGNSSFDALTYLQSLQKCTNNQRVEDLWFYNPKIVSEGR